MIRRLLPEGVDRRGLLLLTWGHAGSDLCQGAVPALLPFMVVERGYSYAAIGALYLFPSIGSSIAQPLIGLYADRIRAGWLIPAGLLAGGLGIAGAGVAPTFGLTALSLALGGLGVAAFHPEAARFASHVAARRPGAGMSVFAVGGNAGFALGPILVTPAVVAFGLPGAGIAAVFTILAGLAIAFRLGYLERFRPGPHASRRPGGHGRENAWGIFGVASGAATLRTGFAFGLMAFVPSYFVASLGTSEAVGNAAITGMPWLERSERSSAAVSPIGSGSGQ